MFEHTSIRGIVSDLHRLEGYDAGFQALASRGEHSTEP